MGAVFPFLVGVIGGIRWILVFDHTSEIGAAPLSSWLLFTFRGIQFDARVAGLFLLPFFLLLLLLAPYPSSFRRSLGFFHNSVRCLLLVTPLLGLVDILYVQEYHERFSFWLFNFFFDDRRAILKTIFTSYPWGKYAFCLGLIFWLLHKIYAKMIHCIDAIHGQLPARIAYPLPWLLLLFLVVAARGSFVRRPLQQIDVAITGNALLNHCLPNSYYALYFAHKEYRKQHSAVHILRHLSEKKRDQAFAVLSGHREANLASLTHHEALGHVLTPRPRHLFLIVGESLDSWPLLKTYEALNLYPCLRELARQGAYNPHFIPSGEGTAMAIMTQICNFPPLGLWPNYRAEGYRRSDFSVGYLFQKLGYRPRLFYGGYLSWQRIEDYARAHGFLDIFGGDVMEFYHGNEWGIDDEGLFRFVSEQFKEEEGSTFNLILTTSNHPPFNIDLEKAQVPLSSFRHFSAGEKSLRHLGHAWYADRCIGRFVQNMSERYPDALFVITGDHFSRRHLRPNASLYECTSVPLILYGRSANDTLHSRPMVPGSHLDLVRTVLELVAPRGFSYRSFGKNLFDPTSAREAHGAAVSITDDHVIHHATAKVEPLPLEAFFLDSTSEVQNSLSSDDIRGIIDRHEAWQTLAQWEFFYPDNP